MYIHVQVNKILYLFYYVNCVIISDKNIHSGLKAEPADIIVLTYPILRLIQI